jgi:hypothetical protein
MVSWVYIYLHGFSRRTSCHLLMYWRHDPITSSTPIGNRKRKVRGKMVFEFLEGNTNRANPPSLRVLPFQGYSLLTTNLLSGFNNRKIKEISEMSWKVKVAIAVERSLDMSDSDQSSMGLGATTITTDASLTYPAKNTTRALYQRIL